MKYKVILLIGVCAAPPWLLSQVGKPASVVKSGSDGSSQMLQITTEAKTQFAGSLAGTAKCDDRAEIYFRPTDSETSKIYHPVSALPVRRIGHDGSLTGSFSIADSFPGLLARDFFVTREGKLYQAARSETNQTVFVVSYSANGSPASKVQMDGGFFVPYELVVFRSGEFLISGLHGENNRTPFTAIYGKNGKLIREIYEPEDEDARKRAEAGELGFRPDTMESSNDFVARGDAELGSDGNAYLLRSGSLALIYVVSAKGEIIRKLRIPAPSSGLWAQSLHSAPGEIAISFLMKGTNKGVIEVIDYHGAPLATFAAEDRRMYPGLLGCYSPNRLTFLSLEDGGSVGVNIAVPK